jgi:hypothetical protein
MSVELCLPYPFKDKVEYKLLKLPYIQMPVKFALAAHYFLTGDENSSASIRLTEAAEVTRGDRGLIASLPTPDELGSDLVEAGNRVVRALYSDSKAADETAMSAISVCRFLPNHFFLNGGTTHMTCVSAAIYCMATIVHSARSRAAFLVLLNRGGRGLTTVECIDVDKGIVTVSYDGKKEDTERNETTNGTLVSSDEPPLDSLCPDYNI